MHPFEVMAEPIRRRMVEILASGEHTSGTLEEIIMIEFGVGRSAVQHHLGVFKRNGWVDIRPDYTERWYRLEPDVVPGLVRETKRLRKLWNARFGALERRDPPIPAPRVPLQRNPRGRRGYGADPDDPWYANVRAEIDRRMP